MSEDLRLVHPIETSGGKDGGFIIFCPACQQGHVFDHRWKFNNNFESPTFTPSMHVFGSEETRKKTNGRYGQKCHSFVTDGKIKFLNDCTHDMKGQTVDLDPF